MLVQEPPPAVNGSAAFLRRMTARPEGQRLRQCIQCGTCSASCPSSHAMDLPPRRILAALNADLLDRVLASRSVWLCASCYQCTVRCPSGVPVTDLMYALKREAHARGAGDPRGRAMAKAFVHNVEKLGRNSEVGLLMRYYFVSGLLRALPAVPLALRMLRRGRLALRSQRIKDVSGLQRMLSAAKGAGGES